MGGRKKDAMNLKEKNRLKNSCCANSSIYALFMVHCLPLRPWAMAMSVHQIHAMPRTTETTETNNAIMRYMKSLTPSPLVVMTSLLVVVFMMKI